MWSVPFNLAIHKSYLAIGKWIQQRNEICGKDYSKEKLSFNFFFLFEVNSGRGRSNWIWCYYGKLLWGWTSALIVNFKKYQNLILFCFRYGVQWGEIQQRRKMSNIFLHSLNKITNAKKSHSYSTQLILFHLELKSRLNIERKTFSILQRISSWFVLPQKELLFSYTNYRSLRKILL